MTKAQPDGASMVTDVPLTVAPSESRPYMPGSTASSAAAAGSVA